MRELALTNRWLQSKWAIHVVLGPEAVEFSHFAQLCGLPLTGLISSSSWQKTFQEGWQQLSIQLALHHKNETIHPNGIIGASLLWGRLGCSAVQGTVDQCYLSFYPSL